MPAVGVARGPLGRWPQPAHPDTAGGRESEHPDTCRDWTKVSHKGIILFVESSLFGGTLAK